MKIFGCPIGSEYLSTISHYFEFLICGFGNFIIIFLIVSFNLNFLFFIFNRFFFLPLL
jgi:hypothetical protein